VEQRNEKGEYKMLNIECPISNDEVKKKTVVFVFTF